MTEGKDRPLDTAPTETSELERLREALKRYEQLSHFLAKIDSAGTLDELLQVVLTGALSLTGVTRGWISLLEPTARRLRIKVGIGEPEDKPLRYGQGITGKALVDLVPVRADDVREQSWLGIYEPFWPDTRSELAIPIFVRDAKVRMRTEILNASKRLGVINLESPHQNAFSAADEALLTSLAGHAAVVLDRMDLDRKLAELGHVQQEIVGKQDWDEIVRIVTSAIAQALRYDYVNVSVIVPETQTIRTEHVIGLPDGKVEEFKKRAVHPLGSNDIQSAIVRSREIEVPDANDLRFDPDIYRAFGHDRIIRVFMPMIAPSNSQVIGTIDAGYRRNDWQNIYEDDVRVLRQFVEYAAEALLRRRAGLLDEITHELRSPLVGIRNNLAYLKGRLDSETQKPMERKFDDMLLDCEIVLFKINELEYFLGRPRPKSRIEPTLVYRDVVIAARNELIPELKQRGLDVNKLAVTSGDIARIGTLYVDKVQLKQVVRNLLINAIKYRETDPQKFSLRIFVESTPSGTEICFADNGIGINDRYADRIFESGFRTPEAIAHSVTGSGLGLAIAQRIMRDMGGDLRLTRNSKPTEFRMVLPRGLKEAPDDSIH